MDVDPDLAKVYGWKFALVDLSEEDHAVPILGDVHTADDVEFLRIDAADGSGVHRCQVSDEREKVAVPGSFGEGTGVFQCLTSRACLALWVVWAY